MKKQITPSLLIFCLATLPGCVTTPYDVPQLSEELPAVQEDKERYVVQEAWWQAYDNTELNALVDKALINNPDYLKAALTLQKELYNLD